MKEVVLYKAVASRLDGYQRSKVGNKPEWSREHEVILNQLLDRLPSGAGWDCGVKLDLDASNPEKLVFYGSFHHMDDKGYYDGWTDHTIIVKPSLFTEITLKVTGRNRNGIKDYLHQMFHESLTQMIPLEES